MRKMAEVAKAENLSTDEVEAINNEINNIAEQVRALDSESRRREDGKSIIRRV
jgi:polyhydroxyalkanoate synthesis regulator phasin